MIQLESGVVGLAFVGGNFDAQIPAQHKIEATTGQVKCQGNQCRCVYLCGIIVRIDKQTAFEVDYKIY